MNYPPEFSISVTGQFGQFELACSECEIRFVFHSGTMWETIDIARMAHSDWHLDRLLRVGGDGNER